MRMSRSLWIQTTVMNHSSSTTQFAVRQVTSRARSFLIARSRSPYRTLRTVAVMLAVQGTTNLLVCLRSASTPTTATLTVSAPALKSLALARALATDAEVVIKTWHSTKRSPKMLKSKRTKTSFVCLSRWGERPCLAISWIWAQKKRRINNKRTREVDVIPSQWAPWELTILRTLLTQWAMLKTQASPPKSRNRTVAN